MSRIILSITIVIIICFSLAVDAQEKQKPKATYMVGAAKVTVWEHKRHGKTGEFVAKSFEVEKVFKKNDKWETTNSFSETELLQLKAAIDKAIAEESVKTKSVPDSASKNK